MKLRNKLIATIVSISMVLAVIGVGAWASTESFTATITNTVNLEFDNLKGKVYVTAMAGADNLLQKDEPYLAETLIYDGSNIIYNQISQNITSGTNLYWAGTKFFDTSDNGLNVLNNETMAAAFGYVLTYMPTEDCVGASTITIMVNETSAPEISGGNLMVKYFASTDGENFTEITNGVAITPIADNQLLNVVAVCQYYNMDGVSVSTIDSAWDFEVVFTSGRSVATPITGSIVLTPQSIGLGIILPLDTQVDPYDPASLFEIIEFGEYPQSLKANDVTITNAEPDAKGYYTGSDGAKYAKLTAAISDEGATYGMNIAGNGTVMRNGVEYYFKVEPIKWRVLYEANGETLIVAHNILTAMAYQDDSTITGAPEGTHQSNYYYSDLRAYLTGDFYNTAFTTAEQNQILVTTVDNSGVLTVNDYNIRENEYGCENTNDKVFALSGNELYEARYGMVESNDAVRYFATTDYAKASGAWTWTKQYFDSELVEVGSAVLAEILYPVIGSGLSWSRTPTVSEMVIQNLLASLDSAMVREKTVGVVPAMNISR